jgi:hypothetical protein
MLGRWSLGISGRGSCPGGSSPGRRSECPSGGAVVVKGDSWVRLGAIGWRLCCCSVLAAMGGVSWTLGNMSSQSGGEKERRRCGAVLSGGSVATDGSKCCWRCDVVELV